jgi:hypothetical protein
MFTTTAAATTTTTTLLLLLLLLILIPVSTFIQGIYNNVLENKLIPVVVPSKA